MAAFEQVIGRQLSCPVVLPPQTHAARWVMKEKTGWKTKLLFLYLTQDYQVNVTGSVGS